ncbi:MAG TPA: SRPBCC domain-containing protein [Gammaproteobacteria bacterium]|nr:SRPBCC domain-containing protein [Gammaproteobacteria bacterium]
MSEATLVRRIAARPSIVFEALTTSEGMTSWWGPADVPVLSAAADVKVGGRFCVRFRTTDGLEHECAGEFLKIEAPRHIVMSWQWTSGGQAEEKERVSRVEMRLRPIDTGTELTLIHAELFDEVSAASHEGGWAGALIKLLRRFPAPASTAAG